MNLFLKCTLINLPERRERKGLTAHIIAAPAAWLLFAQSY